MTGGRALAAAALAGGLATAGTALARAEPQVFGYLEHVMLDPARSLMLEAKLDTGADTSSLDARNIRRVRAGDRRYVRFLVTDPESGETIELRKPFLRRVRIKRHSGEHQVRLVVRMRICLGGQSRSVEVNLVDRGRFEYPLLLGRSALDGIALIDPSRKFTLEPSCWDLAPPGPRSPAEGAAVEGAEAARPAPPLRDETGSPGRDSEAATGSQPGSGSDGDAGSQPGPGSEGEAGSQPGSGSEGETDSAAESDSDSGADDDSGSEGDSAPEQPDTGDDEDIGETQPDETEEPEDDVEVLEEGPTVPEDDDMELPEAGPTGHVDDDEGDGVSDNPQSGERATSNEGGLR